MNTDPLDVIKKNDPELFDSISATRNLAFRDGALDVKSKLLIALAIDAAHGAVNGVKSLAMQALNSGATKEEIMETLHVTCFVSGAGSIYTAAAGLQGILSQS